MISPNLIHPKCDRFVLVGILALDYQYWDSVDQEYNILTRAVVAIVKGEFFGDFKNVASWIVVVDQDQVTLSILLVIEELAPVAKVLDEFTVAIDVGV